VSGALKISEHALACGDVPAISCTRNGSRCRLRRPSRSSQRQGTGLCVSRISRWFFRSLRASRRCGSASPSWPSASSISSKSGAGRRPCRGRRGRSCRWLRSGCSRRATSPLAKWFTIRNDISLPAIGELVLALTPGVNVVYGWDWFVDILWFNGKLLAAISAEERRHRRPAHSRSGTSSIAATASEKPNPARTMAATSRSRRSARLRSRCGPSRRRLA